jgi:hypothetical protein
VEQGAILGGTQGGHHVLRALVVSVRVLPAQGRV